MRTISILGAAVFTASAHAQYSYHLYGMPDFDQKRNTLPGNGAMWCAPTAATDLMGYISNHGFPAIMDGPRNWQVHGDDADVAFTLNLMGLYMDTDAEGGTGGDWGSGVVDFMNLEAAGLFTVTQRNLTAPLNQVTPFFMFTHLATGSLVEFCYGRYQQQGDGSYRRNSGHCVALTGMDDAFSGLPTVSFRNPGTDGTITAQSIFATEAYDCAADDLTVNGVVYHMWEMLTNNNDGLRRFIDGYISVDTTFVLTPTTPGVLMQFKPFTLTGDPTPHVGSFPGPAGAQLIGAALHPDLLHCFVTTAPGGAGQPQLWRYSRHDHSFAPLLTITSPFAPMCTGRFGDLYLYTGGQVRCFDAIGTPAIQLHSFTPAAAPGAMTYDDVNDKVIALLPSTRRLLILPRTLDPVVDKALPAGVVLSGDPSVGAGARGSQFEGKYFIASTAHAAIYVLGIDPGTQRLVIEDTITLAGLSTPSNLQVSDIGTLVVGNGGTLLEIEKISTGWRMRPGSRFAGLGCGPKFTLSRSRSNFDRAVYPSPAWDNTIDAPAGREVPDAACSADFDGDGDAATDADIEAFFACLAGNCCPLCWSADFDHDGDAATDADIEAFFRVLAGGNCN